MDQTNPLADSALEKRRWYQFSLRSLLIFITICAILLAAWRWYYVAKPWIPIEPNMVIVASSEQNEGIRSIELRMNRPFELALIHRLRKSDGAIVKSEPVLHVSSQYHLARGHFIIFRISQKPPFQIESEGVTTHVNAWLSAGPIHIEMTTDTETFYEGTGLCLAYISENKEFQEVIELFAGTNLHLDDK